MDVLNEFEELVFRLSPKELWKLSTGNELIRDSRRPYKEETPEEYIARVSKMWVNWLERLSNNKTSIEETHESVDDDWEDEGESSIDMDRHFNNLSNNWDGRYG